MVVDIPPFPDIQATTQEFLEWLQENLSIQVPEGFLIGNIGSTTPPPNSGPWLKDGLSWYIWDVGSASYVPLTTGSEIGEIKAFAFAALDLTRYVPCDGSAIPRVAPYNALYAKIGTTFGLGDGSTTFNVPDLRGRTIVGAGTGTGLTARNLADALGEEKHAMVANESPLIIASTNTAGAAAGSVVANPTIVAHNNMQPSSVQTYAIRYG